MDDTVKARAEARTEAAISEGPYQDFREAYRERLRWLKDARPDGFAKALQHYEELVQNIADGADVAAEWLRYGRFLGELSGDGNVVSIDPTGRSVAPTHASDQMLLHLPQDIGVPALALAIPRQITDAQRSTLDLLVRRKLSLE